MKSFVLILVCLYVTTVWTLRKVPDSKPNSRIIDGQTADPGEYPWIAAIYKYTPDGRYFCGGSIWSENFILTAAQCVYNATRFDIQVGSNQLSGSDPNRITLTATTWYVEPRYEQDFFHHDVGLIRLDSPLVLNDYIQPVKRLKHSMPPAYPGCPVQTAGWGQTSDTGDLNNDLMRVDMSIVGYFTCRAIYGDTIWPVNVCTSGNSNEGTCFGDIGGPLMGKARINDDIILYGIATYLSGNGCESSDPSGFTHLADNYRNWIQNVTGVK